MSRLVIFTSLLVLVSGLSIDEKRKQDEMKIQVAKTYVKMIRGESWDCAPPGSSYIKLNSMSLSPKPIIYPGKVDIMTDMDILKDIPSENLYMKLDLLKLEPQKMKVPCFNGIGSCKYDVCNDVIPNHKEQFCALGACQCPLTKGKHKTKNPVPFEIPNLGGAIFKKLLAGNYNGNISFYNNEDQTVYACLGMKFSIEAAP